MNYLIGVFGLLVFEIFFVRMFKSNGYMIVVFGKWYVGGIVEFGFNVYGFDWFFGFLGFNIDFYFYWEVVFYFWVFDLFEDISFVECEGYMIDLIIECSIFFIE